MDTESWKRLAIEMTCASVRCYLFCARAGIVDGQEIDQRKAVRMLWKNHIFSVTAIVESVRFIFLCYDRRESAEIADSIWSFAGIDREMIVRMLNDKQKLEQLCRRFSGSD